MMISTDNGTARNLFGDMEALRMIHEAGFDGVDFTFYDPAPEQDILALPEEERYALAMELKAYADKVGLSFPQAHAPYYTKPGEGSESKHYQDVVKSMQFAAWLGCPQIVVHTLKFPGAPYGFDIDAPNREFMLSLLPYAEEYGIDIGIENLYRPDPKRGCYEGQHGTPEEINAFVDSLNSPRFKVCCDLGHAAIVGTEPQDFILGMDASRLTMLHIHDTDYRSDSHVLPFMGKQDWDAIAAALAKIGFTGAINLEALFFYEMFPPELMPSALTLAADTARRLAEMVEERK
ncbi:MAG: sugar phosphate isomerase/epimerase [Clostridia bacterium]|nr:sugar phosphate isomerase/epimerase [Clostridia bacterium]